MSTIQQDIDQIANETAQGGNSKTRIAAILERIYNEPKPLDVETDYPTTTPLKAGQRFIYKGNEWHYMTQEEIDSTGWTGLVDVGFPAPVRKVYDMTLFASDVKIILFGNPQLLNMIHESESIIDFLGLGNPITYACYLANFPYKITQFKNAELLGSLEDIGTLNALNLINKTLTDSAINSLFNQLPNTLKTVTVNVSNNPGAATCDPSIATAKGYTVIT